VSLEDEVHALIGAPLMKSDLATLAALAGEEGMQMTPHDKEQIVLDLISGLGEAVRRVARAIDELEK
jgi:hypothetical protein